MVPEDACDNEISQILSNTTTTNKWIPDDSSNKCDISENNNTNFVRGILDDIFDSAVPKEIVFKVPKMRDRNMEKEDLERRKSNRGASLYINNNNTVETFNDFIIPHRRAISECIIDENDNNDFRQIYDNKSNLHPKTVKKVKDYTKKRKFSFSLFHKKDKPHRDHIDEEHPENYDDFDPSENVLKPEISHLKKAFSAMELNQKPTKLQRTNSFIKKMVHIGAESTSILKRSLSVRDVKKTQNKKDSKTRCASESNEKWRQSLQSLVESDIGVSYNDLSFINYDALNKFNYDDEDYGSHVSLLDNSNDGRYIGRTQSMICKSSPKLTARPSYLRTESSVEYSQPDLSLSEQSGATSLPILCHLNNHENNGANVQESNSPTHRLFQRRPQSISSEDGCRSRSSASGSFRSAGSGCAKLKRHNACRQKNRNPSSLNIEIRRNSDPSEKTLFSIVKLFSTKPTPKIARESLNIEKEEKGGTGCGEGQHQQEWRRFVGSIRRKVQRHASGGQEQQASQAKGEPLVRKNSLTQSKFDLFKRDKSTEEAKKSDKQTLTKQKSIGPEKTTTCDYFKALSFKDKSSKDSPVASPKQGETSSVQQKGVRKSDKKDSSSDKAALKPSISFSRSKSSKSKEGLKQDDFLKATMRIFLVVSPPVGKMQVRSRSLNHLDNLEMRQGIAPPDDAALKDTRSEPDCTNQAPAPGPNQTALQTDQQVCAAEAPPPRKHMLSRSQKSSSECFTATFEVGLCDETWDNELFFPAHRGFTLQDQLVRMCESRNIDLSMCEARLVDKETNTESLLLFTQDTANLVGKHVRIIAKEASNKKLSGSFHSNHLRKQSGSYRPRTSSFFNSSTEEATPIATSTFSLHEGENKRQIKQRFTAFFGNTKDAKLEALIEQLDKYTKQGIPSSLNYRQGQCESVDALYKLEDDWKDIVEYGDLSEKQQQQQTVLWELIKTEVAYIKTLKVVTDLFLACLKDLQSKTLLKEIDTVKLFSNITEILDANVIFWRNTLFPLVRTMRQYKRPPCIENMLEGFSQIHEVFQPYYIYCAEQSRCQHYCRENLDSEFFTAYLT
ncbi:unnamed protein product [Brassicogethes aeneus]|uniref:DH domain-containing protein n=1 Tax=Brassicogethes aeneus TaxID=1431903 RepID=A0A9P0B981_BRAAE|nr:unnamed protein product [Brassicogethes aeneus]